MVGLAIGVVVFPRTTTITTTQATTTTQIITYQATLSSTGRGSGAGGYPVVTLTAIIVDVYHLAGECTTSAGTPMVTHTEFPGDQTTTVVTIYNGTLQQQYMATVTTDCASQSASFTTQPFTGPC